jgi:putative resolvase
MNTLKYVSGKEALKILGIHERTLYLWDKAKKIETIRTPGNKRLYNITKFLSDRTPNDNNNINELDDNNINEKIKIVYVRVSSLSQKDDLERQKNYIIKKLYNKKISKSLFNRRYRFRYKL